ncbi:MAG: hypothetical protein HYS67_02830 [Deltaproteobacteria bacterium]|nr:hypothetical protein [Deltaproteobacteria bacterium]MBI2538893.1 hypothetical protein [Deltaproteobacteria bacterium]
MASTIILLRPEAGGKFEVFLTRRPPDMEVLAGFYVFPGGILEQKDYSEQMLRRCRGLSSSEAQRTLGNDLSPELSLGHSVAAVRELFEEVGILFSVTENGAAPDLRQDDLQNRLAEKRQSLVAGGIEFRQLLESEGLYCDLSRPVYFSHRVTPEKHAVRFDTRFYLAQLPSDQHPLFSSQEVAESLWLTPAEVLERSEKNGFALMPPTLIALRALAAFGSWQTLRERYPLK